MPEKTDIEEANIEREDLAFPVAKPVAIPEITGDMLVELTARQKKALQACKDSLDPDKSFGQRFRAFFGGTSKAGRWGKTIKDAVLMFTPYGRQINDITDFVTQQYIKRKQTKTRMETTKHKILRILNQPSTKAALTGIISVVGFFFTFHQSVSTVVSVLLSSAVGIVTGVCTIYSGYRHIGNLFTDDAKEIKNK